MNFQVNKEFRMRREGEPPLYQVMMHDDGFTPVEFVMGTLERLFYMTRQRAAEMMLEIRVKGQGICGVFSKDGAEAKVIQVLKHAKQHQQPLRCSMEEAQ